MKSMRVPIYLLFTLALFLSACGNSRPFNSTAWLQGDHRARGRMSENLVKSRTLIGKTVDETQQLLGPPDTTYPSALAYKIDLGWPFKDPQTYGLQVHLDERRRVREVKIVD